MNSNPDDNILFENRKRKCAKDKNFYHKFFTFFRYPQSLHFLELLQYEHFRKELVNAQCAKFIDDQQLLHWQHYQRKRMQLLTAQADEAQKQKENKPG